MTMPKSEPRQDAGDWAAALAELENFDWQPSEEDYRAAMREAVAVFRQGRLTAAELNWVLSLLAAQLINRKFERILLNFGGAAKGGPGFAFAATLPYNFLGRSRFAALRRQYRS